MCLNIYTHRYINIQLSIFKSVPAGFLWTQQFWMTCCCSRISPVQMAHHGPPGLHF